MKTLAVVLALLATALCAMAQQPSQTVEPPELVAKRAEHIRAMNRAQIAPLTAYIQALTFLKQQYVREAKAAAAAAVDAEIKIATDDLAAANAVTDITTAAPVQLQIDQALYGDFQRNRSVDVTAYIQNAFKSGAATVSIRGTDMAGATDPSPGVAKSLKVIYTYNGKKKEKVFKTGTDVMLDFKRELR